MRASPHYLDLTKLTQSDVGTEKSHRADRTLWWLLMGLALLAPLLFSRGVLGGAQ